MTTRERRASAKLAARASDGVLSRRALERHGVDARMIRREIAAERWRAHGRQTVALHTGALGERALWWRAVWEVGTGIAVLDGATALRVAGMSGFEDDVVHVSVLHRHDVRPVPGVRIHQVIRRVGGEVIGRGPPRTRPEVAAIRAAHWAMSDRQAALLLCMPVQQRIVDGDRLLSASTLVRGRTRRAFVDGVVGDIADGAHALGELDFAAACRRRRLPEPARQSIRQGPRGRIYLDVRWRNGLVVEIDGAAHRWGLAASDDGLRANHVALTEELVLRIELLGWRLHEREYMDQVCAGYRLREARTAA